MVSCISLLSEVWFTLPSSSSTTGLLLLSLTHSLKCPDPLHFLYCFPLAGHRRSLALCPVYPQQKLLTFLALASPFQFVFPLTLFTSLRTPLRTPLRTSLLTTDLTTSSFDLTGLFFRFLHRTSNFS